MTHETCCGRPDCTDPCPGGSHPLIGDALTNPKLDDRRFAQEYGMPTPGYPYHTASH